MANHLLDTKFLYTFESFFHPYVGFLREKLNEGSLAQLLSPATQGMKDDAFFAKYYTEGDGEGADGPFEIRSYPKKNIDLEDGGAYATYNWELFFHIPLTIAVHLSKNQRFADAQRWFHYVFDPTSTDDVPSPGRYWKFLAFRENNDVGFIEDILAQWAAGSLSEDDRRRLVAGYDRLKEAPFEPHVVARTRTVSYQYSVVMRYLDNLIAWGDSLFRQDTIETINEATMLYVLAANILGPRPQRVPPAGKIQPRTFNQIKDLGQDALHNPLVALEGEFPFNFAASEGDGGVGSSGPLWGLGGALYFCVPRNEKLLGYWDTVADRLFKLRHCMNIEGVVRQLALFDPPIDPGMLVKAAAAGIDVGSVVSGLNQPIGPLRCMPMMQKAMELVGEVRGLGNTLLSAMEKREGERLGMLRQGHEIKIQKAMQEVRYLQWGAAQNATEALLRGRDSVLERYKYYLRLQGGAPDADTTPETFEADRRELTEENFGDVYTALVGQYEKAIVLQDYAALKLHDEGSLKLHVGEHEELNKYAADAALARMLAAGVEGLTSALAAIPNINAKVALWGVGGESELTGGAFLANIGRAVSAGFNLMATGADRKGQSVLKTASYELRAHDRILQANLAAHELMQIGRQIISSLIAEQIARHEYESIKAQIRSAQEVATFLETKFTNEELYGWMQGELSRVYYEYYRFAIDTARKAERTMKQELMRPEVDATSFIQFNYWDAGRKGLLSGDALHLDLKRMEMAYHDNNKRELEITRHVSLRQLDPLALLRLKVDGTCEVEIPEWFYDLDCPGHYMRRIKTVSLSLPAVAGAYTSVSCTLTLLRSTIRKSPLPKEGAYARVDNDDRFIDYFGASQSIVTSTGTNDGGLFETNLHDERFLPFEGAGAISRWRLTLPKKLRQFDYDTITDAILHVRYTARQGGETLGGMATEAVKAAFELKSSPPLLFSLRHDFPTEWASYARGTANLTVRLRREHFPYWVQGEALLIERIELYSGEALTRTSIEAPDPTAPFGEFADVVVSTGSLARDSEANVFMVVSYSLEPSA